MVFTKKINQLVIVIAIFLLLFSITMSFPMETFGVSKKKVVIKGVGKTFTLPKKGKKNLNIKLNFKKKKKRIIWKSSKPSIVKVSENGVMRARKRGKAIISVYIKVGSKKIKDSVEVSVGKKITKVTSPIKNLVLKKGEKKILPLQVTPTNASNKKISFVSTKKNIASVNKNGKISAKKKGSAYVYAKATDGTGKKHKTKVIVGTKVKKVKVTGEKVLVRGTSVTYKASITPSNASYKNIVWKSSNPEIVKITSKGKATYVKTGEATITATSQDGTNKIGKLKIKTLALTKSMTKYIAHRGLSAVAPENTLTAFELAAQAGFWGIECDIRLSKADQFGKREWMISHDSSLKRLTGLNQNVSDLTADELKNTPIIAGNGIDKYNDEYIASLEEYLQILKPYKNSHAIIEIKNSTISQKGLDMINDLLAKYDMFDRAMIISFYTAPLISVKSYNSEISSGAISSSAISGSAIQSINTVKTMLLCEDEYAITDDILSAINNKFDGVSFSVNIFNKYCVDFCRVNNLEIGVWTVANSLEAYKVINNLGTDYLTSDKKVYY